MGMDAEVIAIGPFSQSLAECGALGYPEKYYVNCKSGETVIVSGVLQMRTNQGSAALAEALGTEAWTLNKHVINTKKIDWVKVEMVMRDQAAHEASGDLFHMQQLADAGFTFYYLPNG